MRGAGAQIRYAAQGEDLCTLGQCLLDRLEVVDGAIAPREDCSVDHSSAGAKYDVIAKTAQFVDAIRPLGQDFDLTDLRESSAQAHEERRFEQQFVLLIGSPTGEFDQGPSIYVRPRAMALDREVQSLLQPAVADVPEEDRSAGGQACLHQVRNAVNPVCLVDVVLHNRRQ